jgi:hypothetical protein
MACHVAEYFNIPHRKGTSPVRTLIDATFPALDPKQQMVAGTRICRVDKGNR